MFTKLDQASCHHQLRIQLDDRHKTLFVALNGFYQWKVKLFVLANMPSAVMYHIHHILGRYKKLAIGYLDDVLSSLAVWRRT